MSVYDEVIHFVSYKKTHYSSEYTLFLIDFRRRGREGGETHRLVVLLIIF